MAQQWNLHMLAWVEVRSKYPAQTFKNRNIYRHKLFEPKSLQWEVIYKADEVPSDSVRAAEIFIGQRFIQQVFTRSDRMKAPPFPSHTSFAPVAEWTGRWQVWIIIQKQTEYEPQNL